MKIHQIEQKIKDLETTASELKSSEEEVKIAVNVAYGFALLDWQPYTSFNYFLKAFRLSLETNNAKWIGQSLKCMENVPKVISRANKKGEKIEDIAKGKLLPDVPEDIQKLDLYKAYKSMIDKVYKEVYKLSNNCKK